MALFSRGPKPSAKFGTYKIIGGDLLMPWNINPRKFCHLPLAGASTTLGLGWSNDGRGTDRDYFEVTLGDGSKLTLESRGETTGATLAFQRAINAAASQDN